MQVSSSVQKAPLNVSTYMEIDTTKTAVPMSTALRNNAPFQTLGAQKILVSVNFDVSLYQSQEPASNSLALLKLCYSVYYATLL